MLRALAVAALLLLAALAAGPAYAQDAGGGPTPPSVSDPAPPPPPVADATPAPPPPTAPTQAPDQPASTPPANSTPPPSDPPPATDPGAGQSTPATNDSPAGDAGHKQPAHPNDELTTTTSGSGPSPSATSPTSPSSSTAEPPKDLAKSNTGYSDTWLGQDTFVIDKTTTKDPLGLKTVRRRFAGLFLLGASTKATRMEAKARRSHETEKVSSLGSGPPRPGNPLPGENAFFNLMSGSGGVGVSLMLAGLLGVLGAAFVLPRDRRTAFRMPTDLWGPLAYVPPIELPG